MFVTKPSVSEPVTVSSLLWINLLSVAGCRGVMAWGNVGDICCSSRVIIILIGCTKKFQSSSSIYAMLKLESVKHITGTT